MAGRLGQRAGLPPAGDPPVHQARIDRQALFGDAGAEAFDQAVGVGQQLLDQLDCLRVLEVQGNGLAVAQQQVVLEGLLHPQLHRLAPLDAQHRRAQVGEHHGRHGAGADAGQLDYLHACKWAHECFPSM
ncbi:hypothetical protein D3C77_369860 [compost metagenome]